MIAGRRMTFLHGAQRDIIDRTGSTPPGAVKALQALTGTSSKESNRAGGHVI